MALMSVRRTLPAVSIATVLAIAAAVPVASASAAGPVGANACQGFSDPQHKTVKVAALNLRIGPGVGYRAKGSLARGDRLFEECYRDVKKDRWYHVKLLAKSHNGLPKGATGWVNRKYVRDTY
ncbi:hypothetical protein [Streptomyces sp. NPDC001933]|uniref:hypothetical protein n=1 Tax=Streptomyces sp. NPDC001933 TaxID=3364626 RepID=UPI003676E263